MKVIQINLNRCRAAHDVLDCTAREAGADLCLLSEPNKKIVEERGWARDEAGDVAIWQRNSALAVCGRGSGVGFTWIELEGVAVFYSCYFSPNKSTEEYAGFLDGLTRDIAHHAGKKVVIGGDFNGWATDWGCSHTNERGQQVLEWAARNDLVVLNDGSPTFRRGETSSAIDLTLCTERTREDVAKWSVLEQTETLSDHLLIELVLHGAGAGGGQRGSQWKGNKIKQEALVRELTKRFDNQPERTGTVLEEVLKEALQETIPAVHPRSMNRRPVYWWNEEVAEARRECIKARRGLTRSPHPDREAAAALYKEARKTLKLLIKRSKERSWREICEQVENSPWGTGYKIAMKKFKTAPPAMGSDLVAEIVQQLFPNHEEQAHEDRRPFPEEPTEVTEEELREVVSKMKGGTAPGTDGIPPEAAKILLEKFPAQVQEAFNHQLRTGEFPDQWKIARLVLIPKPGKPPGEPSSYRPLCMLSVLAKALEAVITSRITKHLDEAGSLSDDQYGFRRGRSTSHAIERVLEIADKERTKTLKTRAHCLLILLDVKNAFNSIRWDVVMEALDEAGIPAYLTQMIGSYLKDRYIEVRGVKYRVTAGVPQGSVLGPMLWNVAYDGVLRLQMPGGVTSVAYADDLAITVVEKDEGRLSVNANEALELVAEWMKDQGLALAPQKTEAVLLNGRKRCGPLDICLEGHRIEVKKECKYLGVTLDQGMTFSRHIEEATAKATKAITNLARIMPRMRGPGEGRRRLLATVATSIVMYGAKLWAKKLTGKGRGKLASTQRLMTLRITRAYRTVSGEALQVLARQVPWDLLAEGAAEGSTGEEVRGRWQARWESAQVGSWTRRLIPHIEAWLSRAHGSLSYRLTQALTGHGCFQQYLHRIGRAASPLCVMCGDGAVDDAEHTLFACRRFEEERSRLENTLGHRVSVGCLVEDMLSCEEKWAACLEFVEGAMVAKEEDERQRERRARTAPTDTRSVP